MKILKENVIYIVKIKPHENLEVYLLKKLDIERGRILILWIDPINGLQEMMVSVLKLKTVMHKSIKFFDFVWNYMIK